MTISRAIAATALLSLVGSAHATFMSEWNLVVENDIVLSTSEVDGSAIVGGSVLGGASNYTIQGVTASDGTGLAVGGVLDSGVTVNINNAGDFRISDLANQLGTVNTNGGATIQDPTITSDVAAFMSQASAMSGYFASLAATGTIDGGGNMNSPTTVTIDGQTVAVYTITQAQFDSGLGQLNLNFGAADAVIINFLSDGGNSDLTSPPNIIGGFNQANSGRILWNFPGTTDLTINNSFNGAILAPDAALTLNGGGINGSVVVDSINLQDAEIRNNLYIGPAPAPGAVALLGVVGLARLRRRG